MYLSGNSQLICSVLTRTTGQLTRNVRYPAQSHGTPGCQKGHQIERLQSIRSSNVPFFVQQRGVDISEINSLVYFKCWRLHFRMGRYISTKSPGQALFATSIRQGARSPKEKTSFGTKCVAEQSKLICSLVR